MNDTRFLGISILLAALMISCALVWHAQSQRYQAIFLSGSGSTFTVDTFTGIAQPGFIQPKTK